MVSSELYDLDTEQTQARYDPRILSKTFNTLQRSNSPVDNRDSEENGDGAHCMNANKRYEHGEKVSFICLFS